MRSIDDLLAFPEYQNRRNEALETLETYRWIGRELARKAAAYFDRGIQMLGLERGRVVVPKGKYEKEGAWWSSDAAADHRDFLMELAAVLAIGEWLPDGVTTLGLPSVDEARKGLSDRLKRSRQGAPLENMGRGAELFNKIVKWKADRVLAVGDPFSNGVVELEGNLLSTEAIDWLADLLLEIVQMEVEN